jgi:hypothetical protein
MCICAQVIQAAALDQGCQIFLDAIYQIGDGKTNDDKIYQIDII